MAADNRDESPSGPRAPDGGDTRTTPAPTGTATAAVPVGAVVGAAEEHVEAVLSLVEQVPPGRVTTYGALAAVVGGGPRQVGAVMSRHGGPVPWWRVVRADGSLPPSHLGEAQRRYTEEGTPRRPSGAVDMGGAFWDPARPD